MWVWMYTLNVNVACNIGDEYMYRLIREWVPNIVLWLHLSPVVFDRFRPSFSNKKAFVTSPKVGCMKTKKKHNQYHIFDYLSRENVCSGFFSGKPHRNVTAINASIGKPKRILQLVGEIWQRRSHRLVALLHTRGYWYNRREGWWVKNMPEWNIMTCKKLESWLDWQLIRKLVSWSPLAWKKTFIT